MKSLFSSLAALACSSTLAFSAAVLAPGDVPVTTGPLNQQVEQFPGGTCTTSGGVTKCCADDCGNGRPCCIEVGPIL